MAAQIAEFLTRVRHVKAVSTVSVESLELDKNVAFRNMESEKMARQALKAAVERKISRDSWVILDALNMIKGERYEMHCCARSTETPMCVVYCDVPVETAREWNAARSNPYSADVFNNLLGRMEIPDPTNRWDFPLFTVSLLSPHIDLEELAKALSGGAARQSSMATRPQQLQSTNFLHELDETTQNIVNVIYAAQEFVGGGAPGEVVLPNSKVRVCVSRPVLQTELRRLRRQFTSMMRTRYTTTQSSFSIEQLGDLFAGYLNDNL